MWNVKAKYSIVDDDIYNFDETRFIIGIIFASIVLRPRIVVARQS